MERYYTTEQIAEILQITAETVRNVIKAGELQAIRVGALWRVPESSFRKFLNQK